MVGTLGRGYAKSFIALTHLAMHLSRPGTMSPVDRLQRQHDVAYPGSMMLSMYRVRRIYFCSSKLRALARNRQDVLGIPWLVAQPVSRHESLTWTSNPDLEAGTSQQQDHVMCH